MKKTCMVLAMAGVVVLILGGVEAQAQPGKTHKAEFAMLSSLNFVSFAGDESATALTIPSVSPGMRMTFWSAKSPLIVDFGLSFVHATADEEKATALELEGGLGIDLGSAEAKTRPFMGVLGGMVSASGSGDTQTEGYMGFQAGIRRMVTDYAATRLQIGYRKTMGDVLKVGVFEIAGGLSVFL